MEAQQGEKLSRAVGAQVGGYRLLAWLGRGGMAEVFLATPQGAEGQGRLVALKMLRRELSTSTEVVTQFLDEARLAARLDHPNVIKIFEVGRQDDDLTIVMEYLEGQALGQLVERARERGERVPMGLFLRALADALLGLHYAHEATDVDGKPLRLVHRDVTPHNIFITHEGRVKVLDFGIAKAVTSVAKTRTGTTKGTIRYMAPEHIRGEQVDRRADIFAVGVILFEALTETKMFDGVRAVGVLNRVARGDIPRVQSARADVPERLAQICDRALSADREQRHATCLDLRADIEGYLASQPGPSTADELARLLDRLFGDERQARRALVEAQLRSLSAAGGPEPGELPALGGPRSSRGSIDLGATTASTTVRPLALRSRKARGALMLALVLFGLFLLGAASRGRGYW